MRTALPFLTVAVAVAIPALANPIAVPIADQVVLDEEAVDISIDGGKATVSGVYDFAIEGAYAYKPDYEIHIPVYAAEGTKAEEITPKISLDGKDMEVTRSTETPVRNLPGIDGQSPVWFKATVKKAALQPKGAAKVKITYGQALAGDRFIYTPIIPNQHRNKDYGSITLGSTGTLELEGAEAHKFKKVGGKLIVEPHHLRAIIVKVASAAPPKVP